jgi:hypothetical protein
VESREVVETTEHRPGYWRRVWSALSSTGTDTTGLGTIAAFALATRVTGRVSFRTSIPVEPAAAHDLVRRALLEVCRTRVLAKFPEPISARCFYGEFQNAPLLVRFELEPGDGMRTEIEAICESDGNRSRSVHELRRTEVRRLVEFIAATGG